MAMCHPESADSPLLSRLPSEWSGAFMAEVNRARWTVYLFMRTYRRTCHIIFEAAAKIYNSAPFEEELSILIDKPEKLIDLRHPRDIIIRFLYFAISMMQVDYVCISCAKFHTEYVPQKNSFHKEERNSWFHNNPCKISVPNTEKKAESRFYVFCWEGKAWWETSLFWKISNIFWSRLSLLENVCCKL